MPKKIRDRKTDSSTMNVNVIHEEQLTPGDYMADVLAKIAGSWIFVITFFALLVTWVILNAYLLGGLAPDPYPFILLNLILSCLAAIQAPIILMSQNRQESRDRISAEQDYIVNVKSEVMIEELLKRTEVIENNLSILLERGLLDGSKGHDS